MTTLIIARHGNTFGPNETPTRVGGRTDLPLVASGEDQARKLGKYLKENKLLPDVVYSATLQRTQKTAQLAIQETGLTNPIYPLDIFNEIDYGPDENMPEDTVIARVGENAIKGWNEKAIVPEGWGVDPEEIIRNWQGFADQICAHDDGEIVLVVTSNGIARFAPHITGDFDGFAARFPLKLSTGALGILKYEGGRWHVKDWNIRP
ncbi:MAG: histidine phosphatase family protein [Alphaproteobacteria bacterium]|nr:histidine phosphatase family protein [Alphaproteobacteria bacterium]